MKGWFTHNIGWKLLSLAAAVLLWISVASEPELSTFISVPVEYKGLSADMEINSEIAESVFLEVRGPSAELRSMREARRGYAVILDVSGMESGEHTFTIDASDVRLPRGIQLVRAIPAQIRLRVEPSASRSVPVEVRLADGLPGDLQVVEATPEPSALAISGPASRVARIRAVETDPIEVKPEAGSLEYTVSAYVNDSRVRFLGSPEVRVKVTVEKRTVEKR